MLRVIRDLLKHDGRFRIAFVFLLAVLILSLLSSGLALRPERDLQGAGRHARRRWSISSAPARAARTSSGG